jgi:hypothetical protein
MYIQSYILYHHMKDKRRAGCACAGTRGVEVIIVTVAGSSIVTHAFTRLTKTTHKSVPSLVVCAAL